MNVHTISFFGHREIENSLLIEQCLEKLISNLLYENEYVEFLIGRDGEFDLLVSSIIRRCKRDICEYNSAHIWVLPYLTSEYLNNEEAFQQYYDEIEICDSAATGHYKGAHQTRNRSMVDRSDMVVFCIQHEHGGAWQTMKYAKKQGKHWINICELLGCIDE